ncbi:MAG: glycoside hydrolase family 76 protein [Streptosporangiaceae bacterium]
MILSRSPLARFLALLLAVTVALSLLCASDTLPPRSPFVTEAASAAAGLQRWYRGTTYRSAQWWQSANALETTIDYMQATGSRAYVGDLNRTYLAFYQGDRFVDNYYDDDGWWALAWIKAYDLTGGQRYLRQARAIFEAMTDGWDSTCGGGIWWSTGRTYKNAIANGLFLTVAAELHNRTPGDTWYSDWARREWAWFSGTGMLTRSGLVIDGLNQCKPVLNSPTWTYNQGVLIGGLIALNGITHDRGLLLTARRVASAVIRSPVLSPHGVLREPCEPVSSCDADQTLFKGIFIRNLSKLDSRVDGAPYQDYLRRNARSVWDNDRRADEFGLSWSGPFDGSGTAKQAAALDALTAGIRAGRV